MGALGADRRDPPHKPEHARTGLRRWVIAALAALPISLLFASAAAAESCKDQVERLARQYGLATTPPEARLREGDPVTPPSSPMTAESRGFGATDRVRRPGGVIEPPDTGAARVIPPPPTGDRMETAPDIEAEAEAGQSAGESAQLDAADRIRLESLIMAGRQAGERGQEQMCLDRLEQAREILEKTKGAR